MIDFSCNGEDADDKLEVESDINNSYYICVTNNGVHEEHRFASLNVSLDDAKRLYEAFKKEFEQ